MDRYAFVGQNIAIGRAIKAVLPGQVQYFTSELNFTSNITSRFGYEHPGLDNRQTISYFSLSTQSQVYVIPHAKCDLMTICNLDGSLRCNVYGPDWGSPDRGKSYFGEAAISSGKIFVLYLGDAGYVRDKHERLRSNLPTRLLVFDIDGRHRATIETGHEIVSFCIDEENHRVICYFNNTEHPLGYFSFDFEKNVE